MSHYTLPIRPRTLRRLAAGMCAGAVLAATGLGYAAQSKATPDDYYNDLTNNGLTIWDYPLMLRQGAGVCELLYNDVNPYPVLLATGYSSEIASLIILSAQDALCPGNAVTGSPSAPEPQLLEAI